MKNTQHHPRPAHALGRLLTAGVAAAGLYCTAATAHAQTQWTVGATPAWETGSNWSTGIAPTSSDVVFINTTNTTTPNYPVISTGAQAAKELWVGANSGNPSQLDITGGSLAVTNYFIIGADLTSNATVSQSAGTVTVAGGNTFWIGRNGGTGTYNLSGTGSLTSAKTISIGATSTSTGNFNMSGGTMTVNNSMNIGGTGGSGDGTPTGTFTMSGGTLTTTSWFSIGESGSATGTFNQTGGTVDAANSGGTAVNLGDRDSASGTLNVSGGTFNSTGGGINVGNHWNGTGTNNGTLTVSGSGVVNTGTAANGLKLAAGNGGGGTSTGTVNLNGGTIQTAKIQKGTGSTATFNFNGGTLQATATSTTYMTGLTNAFVKSGGAVIDTSTFNITIGQALLTDAVSLGGGLTKLGSGTLTLTGTNTYTGNTTISAGTLTLGSSAASATFLADTSSLYLTTGALLNLSFTSNSVLESITGLYIDGVQQLAGTWGAVGSGATFENALITGTGLLNVTASAVPEPATYATIFGVLTLAGTVAYRRRKVSQA